MITKFVTNSEKLRTVLIDLQPISMAPNSVTELESYRREPEARVRDMLEARWFEQEEQKLYKAINSAGMVFVMRNPALSRRLSRISKPRTIALDAPQQVDHVDKCERYYNLQSAPVAAHEITHAARASQERLFF